MKIAIVAPSGILPGEYLQGGVAVLRQAGYEVEVMPHVGGPRSQCFAACDAHRAADLREALERTDIDLLWCARGGYGTARTINALGLDRLDAHDKMIVGFSDITCLHSARLRLGRTSLHAPMLKYLAQYGLQDSAVQETLALLRGERPTVRFPLLEGSDTGAVRGRLSGGNLTLLSSLRGTPLDAIREGDILFVEDVGEYNYRTDGMLRSLLYGGALRGLRALLVGQFTDAKEGKTPFGQDGCSIARQVAQEAGIPVFLGYPAGHEPSINHPLLLGANVELANDNGTGVLTYLS